MNRILVVDDEENIREMIKRYATHEGFDVVTASNGQEALDIFRKEDFDVVIMDIMMPGIDGYKTFKRMKEIKEVPCLFLSALNQEEDRLYGFDIGADDYVAKPFSPKELMMRLHVILKRKEKDISSIVIDGLMVDESARRVTIDGKDISLSLKEYELLLYLLKNRGIALRREDILAKVWGYDDCYGDDRTLDTHIKLLRKALGEYATYITTLRGVGYRFEKNI